MPKIELNKREEEALLSRVSQDYEWGKQERDKHTINWYNSRRQYDCQWVELTRIQDDENLDQWIYVPKTRNAVDRIAATLQQHFLPKGRQKLAKVVPSVPTGQLPEAAKMADQVLHAKLDLEGRPAPHLRNAFHTIIVEGDGWIKMRWVNEMRARPDGTPHVINRPEFMYLDNEEIVRDPYAKMDQDIKWVIQEVWKTEEEMWELENRGIFNDGTVAKVIGGGDDSTEDEFRKEVNQPGKGNRVLYKLLEFWGPQHVISAARYDRAVEKKRWAPMENIVATVFKNLVVMRVETNPYALLFDDPTDFEKLPFFKGKMLPIPGTTYGGSMVWRLRQLQREANTIRNQRRQEVESGLNRKIFYNRNRLTELEELYRARYLGFVGVDGDPREVVMDFAPTNMTQGMENEEAIVDADMRDTTGVTHYHTGSVVPGMQKTATGVQSVMGEGNVKLENMTENVAKTLILPLAKMVLECCIQWVQPAEVQEIIGSLGVPPALRDVLLRDFHAELEAGVTATSKQARVDQLERALAYVVQGAGAMPQESMAAMQLIFPELLVYLDMPEAAAIYGETVQRMPMPEQGGQGESIRQTGVPEGRSPTPQEVPR